MLISRRTPSLAALCAFLSFLGACGGDNCKRGNTECISNQLIRTCVPSDDGNQWLVSQCSPAESCITVPALVVRDSRPRDDDAGVDSLVPLTPNQPACVGNCDIGAHECVDEALARYCVSGGVWQLDACEIGERCVSGSCVVGERSGSVRACVPGTKACASGDVAKICDADGSSWVEQRCQPSQTCNDGECKPSPDSSCDSGDSCLDGKTAIRCMGGGRGYALQICEKDLYCEAGRCRGSVCEQGATCIGGNQVRSCIDGETYRDAQCGVNEICEQDRDTARCVPLECTLGVSSCGDPRDERVDKERFFTTCVNGVGTNVPRWVRGECSGATSCNPALTGTNNPCSQECTPGAQRCANDALAGVNDGIESCQDDATWGRIRGCNTGTDSQLVCALVPNPNASELPKAVCAEPICAWVYANPNVGATGACAGAELQKCDDAGQLEAAAACQDGICTNLRSTVTADGRLPGACSAPDAECRDDEAVCVDASGAVTPRFRSCVNGKWSVELETCDNDAPCYTVKGDDGRRSALCGAQCSPGSRRCTDDGRVESCDPSGRYSASAPCSSGTCRELGNNDAACVLECVPGSRSCTGSMTVAPDGFHSGTSQEIVCGADGKRGSARNCPADTVCRASASGVVLGCVACIGPAASGGNAEGTADSRCAPDDANRVQECADNNTWSSGRSCAGTKMCVNPTPGSCGNCTGSNGTMVVCSEAALRANQSTDGCESRGFGTPGAWGGVADCCANYQNGDPGSFAYCK